MFIPPRPEDPKELTRWKVRYYFAHYGLSKEQFFNCFLKRRLKMDPPVFCEDCQHAFQRNMLPDLWRCRDTPIAEDTPTYVRRVGGKGFKRCEEVNIDGKCPLFLHRGDSKEDNPQGGG